MSLRKWASENAPEPLLLVARPIYRAYRKPKRAYCDLQRTSLRVLDSLRVIGPDFIYDDYYYSRLKNDPWRSDAQNIGATLNQYFGPDSVIDFGCAIGAHLEPFYHEGINIKGVEENSDAFDHIVVPEKYVEKYDLRHYYPTEKDYDLVLCIEVAEHIPEQYAGNLVDTLTEAGDTIVFTAATPGQGGTHHINEQPREYWLRKFESNGVEYDRDTVGELRSMLEIEFTYWVTDNLMIFINNE